MKATETISEHTPACDTDPAFEFIRSEQINSLNVVVQEFRHRKTGAQHVHIAADNPENVFLVALRTVPQDSTGVAHILEHTALCGSEKYPVRDPFFMMIRRSLNTFMNAFTSSDWTAYPFASQNRKDYYNLLDVYLDAVFFSRLDELDFAQEGHRVEFAEATDPESPLVFKGVVFNEMKGAMSSVPSTLWHTMCEHLYPTTTYHYNSGGDPEAIPDLTYQQLKAFYETHYHPSNATFITYGDIPAAELQARFERQALGRFEKLEQQISVADEQRLPAPIRVSDSYACSEEGGTESKTHILLGWLLGKATDLKGSLEAHLLCSVLLENSASPLQKLLETTKLGQSPSPICGLDDSQREMCFICGIEGSESEHADALEQQVMDVIREVAENGLPYSQLAASLHQLELSQREIGGDGYPYGLQLILNALTSATHRGDVIAQLNLDPVLAEMQEAIKDPAYIKRLCRELLLENGHRVRLTMTPDTRLAARREQAEADRLEQIKQRLSDDERRQVIERAEALSARQQQQDDASILPKVGLEDIPAEMNYVEVTAKQQAPKLLTSYGAGTNGLVYEQIIVPLPELSEKKIDLLPIYASCLTELGIGKQDYLATQQRQSAVCGGINAYASVRSAPDNPQNLQGYLVVSAKGLARNQAALAELLQETLEQVHFDELDRIQDIVAQASARREMGVVGNGHSLAMAAASGCLSPAAELSHRWSGLAGIRTLKLLDRTIKDNNQLEKLSSQLGKIHRRMLRGSRQWLLVGEDERLSDYQASINSLAEGPADKTFQPFTRPERCHPTQQMWFINTSVNFCARAYATVPMAHPDAAALNVLGTFLRNGYLHRAIREQGGAYGGGGAQDNHTASFRFFSYRDPRLEETLQDFSNSLDWLHSSDHSDAQLEEAILGVIGSMDKPGSPAGEAKHTFHLELFGYNRELRQQHRNRVLAVTVADLQRVAARYLINENISTAIVSSQEKAPVAERLGMDQIYL